MSEVETQYVKHGYWLNTEHGSILGRTITTDIRTGTVTIALLAVLVTIATSHVWNLVVFGLHMARADGKPADGMFRQQQALLRTAAAPASMLADWVKIWWTWRKRSTNALSKSVILCALTALCACATVIAGVFSSYVVDTSNLHVLVQSPECGPLKDNDGNTFSSNNLAFLDYMSKLESFSQPYAQECYSDAHSLPARCRVFVKPNIPLLPERVDCPFSDKICKNYTKPGVAVDSGLVDANDIFGWNLQSHQRIKYRRKATCGVLKTQEYQTVFDAKDYPFNTRELLPGEKNLAAHYGFRRNTGVWANLTMAQSLILANVTRAYTQNTVMRWGAPQRDQMSNFDPLPELATESDADLTLIMINLNQVRYWSPVEDPVFSAHKPFNWIASTTDNMTVYFSDWPNAVMGCKQQFQFCFARKGQSDFCTDLSFLPDNATTANFPGASDLQIAALQLLVDASTEYTNYGAALKNLNATSKYANNNGFVTKDFPNDQWVNEVVGWEKLIWATFQTYMSDYAMGYSARVPALKEYIRKDLTKGEKELCGILRMVKPSGVMNISVLGLAIIITFTVLFTLADLILLKFIIFLKKPRQALAPRIDRWIQDGVFQLQRRAYEANDQGIWTRQDTELPATIDGDLLGDLPVDTVRHCCTHVCAKKGGDVVLPRMGTPKMGIKHSMTVMSDATTIFEGEGDGESKKGASFKEKLSAKASLNSMVKE